MDDSASENKPLIDYTGWLPDCILTLVLENVDPESILKQMTVSKRWKKLSQGEKYWEKSFFHLWDTFIRNHGVLISNFDWYRIKREMELCWQWLVKMVLYAPVINVNRFYISIKGITPEGRTWIYTHGYITGYTAILRVGPQGILVGELFKYSGGLDNNDEFSGNGTISYNRLDLVYTGEWKKSNKDGYGVLTYKDGYTVGCQWKKGEPLGEVRHPDILKKIKQGVCLYENYRPQYIFYDNIGGYCESCWLHCIKGTTFISKQWFINGCSKCNCGC